jgi:hypothetical protein
VKVAVGYIGHCDACDKKSYGDRSSAKRAVRRWHRGEHMVAYACPTVPGLFHVGHLSPGVISGVTSRDVYRGDAA